MNYVIINTLLFILSYCQTIIYPKVTYLTVSVSQNTLKIQSGCDIVGELYYVAYLATQNKPTFTEIVYYSSSISITPPMWQFYGKYTLITTLNFNILLQNVKLNSIYNVDVYCLSSDNVLSYPISKDKINTPINQSKVVILQMYIDDLTISYDQQKTVACNANSKYPQAKSRTYAKNYVQCASQSTTITNVQISTYISSTKPNLLSVYFLEDYSSLQDNIPDEILQQGASELAQIFVANTNLTLSVTNQSVIIDTSTITILPEFKISMNFKNQQLVAAISITNMNGIIVFGISEIGISIELEEFFKFPSSLLLVKDITDTKMNNEVIYTVSKLTIGKDYLVHVAALMSFLRIIEISSIGIAYIITFINDDSSNYIISFIYNLMNNLFTENNQQKQLDDEFDGLTIEKLQTLKRSQLQKRDIHDWLKKRHNEKVKKKYLYFPEQIKQQLEVKKIFKNFDRDGSSINMFEVDNLDMGELYEMFRKNGFKITEEQLQKFFKVVDQDRDNALNWPEFRDSAFNVKAAKVFHQIMKELRLNMYKDNDQKNEADLNDQRADSPAKKYMPLSFNSMISYLSYLATRGELEDQINDEQLSQLDKFKKYVEMMNLADQINNKSSNSQIQNSGTNKKDQDSLNLEAEEQFLKRNTQRFNQFKSSFYNSQQSISQSPIEKQNILIKTHKSDKLPKKVREIDAIVRSHQIPDHQSLFKLKVRNNNSINQLKSDVSKYIHLAKTQYNIDVDEIYKSKNENNTHPKITIKIRSFEEDFRNTLAAHHIDDEISEPYMKFNQEGPLPVIDEKSRQLPQGTFFGDHLPSTLVHELRKYQKTQGNPLNTRTTLFKTQSDFAKTTVSHKDKSKTKFNYERFGYNSLPQTAKCQMTRSNTTTANNQIRLGTNYGNHIHSCQQQRIQGDIQPLLGKSLIK